MNGATVLTKFTADTKDFDSKTKKVTASVSSIAKGIVVATGITKAFSAAWNMVSNSMDGAISRFDTMRNFPKVMSNLGIGADESDQSIKKLSESLKGLPTTLDAAALGVQRLTSKNGDIKKSTSMFLAMNNAILAGGASSEIQASAVEQLSQAYAKGKPDMMEWRTMLMAMPAQLKQVATAMGYVDADALGEALRNGSVSMDEFMNKIIEMNEKGVAGFKSFDEQARNATGGIQTSVTNMKTAVTRGVANMIDSLDTELATTPLGGISKIINTFGSTFESGLTNLGKTIAPIISGLLNGTLDPGEAAKIILEKITKIVKTIVSKLPSIMEKILTALTQILPEIMKAVVDIVMAVSQMLPTMIPTIVNGLIDVLLSILDNIDMMINAGISLIMALIQGIVTAIPILIAKLPLIIISIIKGLIGALPQLIMMAPQIIMAIITGLIEAIPMLIEMAPEIITGIIDGMAGILPQLIDTGKTVINNMYSGLIKALPKLLNAIPQIPSKIKKGLVDGFKNVAEIGLNIVKGIGNGITNGLSWIKNKIKEFVGNVTKFIKKVFKIGSPSKLMETQVGQWIPKGIAVGIDANTDAVNKSMASMQKELSSTFQLSPQVANSAALHYSPTIVNNVNVDVKQDPLGQMVRDVKTFSGGAKNDYNYGLGV